jgi:hypothetical protein
MRIFGLGETSRGLALKRMILKARIADMMMLLFIIHRW